jgi:hypothetical protein
MSGGHFNYEQYRIQRIADEIERLILSNNSDEINEYDYPVGLHYSKETIKEFEIGLDHFKKAIIYAQRIDWLVSCDDSEESFHIRLKNDLEEDPKW